MKYTPASLNEEINYSRQKLRSRVDDMKRIVQGMAGLTDIGKDGVVSPRLLENHYHQIASLVVPRMVSGNPTVRVTTDRAGPAKFKAMVMEASVNAWIRQTQHRMLMQKLATDCLLGWAVAVMHLDRRTAFDDDDDDPMSVPILTRLDQGDAFWDQVASSWTRKAYSGYHYATSEDDLLARADREKGWNKAVIRNLPKDAGTEELDRPKNAPKRGEIVLREVWCPGFRLPNAPKYTNGTIFTLQGNTQSFVRDPVPFHGPPCGPIHLYDIYYVPGQSLGMSPCEAIQPQVDELNQQAELLSYAIKNYKKILLGASQHAIDNGRLDNAKTGAHILLQDFEQMKFKEYEYGGPSQTQVHSFEMLLERLQRQSSFDDAQSGLANANVTATATATASASTGVRTGYIAQRFSDCDESPLRALLWYLCHNRSVRIRVNPEDIGAPDDHEVTVRGGPDNDIEYEDLQLNLDRYSMERVSEGLMQQRAMQLIGLKLQLYQAAPAIAQFADVKKLDAMLDRAFNMDSDGNTIDPDGAAERGEREMEAEMSGGGGYQGQYEAPNTPGQMSNVA